MQALTAMSRLAGPALIVTLLLAPAVARAADGSGNYLIVTASEYDGSAPLNEFIAAKTAQDFNVMTYVAVPGTNKTTIKAYIQSLWDTPNAPDYILLVGDAASSTATSTTLPYWIGGGSKHAVTDLPYACMDEGDDWHPEIAIGRFSVTSVSMLQDVVDKSLFVEAGNYPDPDYVKRGAFLAGTATFDTAEETHDWVIENYFEPNDYEGIKLYASQGAGTQDVANAVNYGCLWVVYYGHSASSGWFDPSFTQSNVRALSNEGLYGVATSHSCNVGNFTLGECFGETWLREANKGAAAVIFPSDYIYWGSYEAWLPSAILERSFFQAMFEDGIWEVGPALHAAFYRFEAEYDGSSDVERNFFEEFVLLGEPGLRLPGLPLHVTPGDDLLPGGPAGGPFVPDSMTYELCNYATYAISYEATHDSVDWVTLSGDLSGTLPPQGTAEVTVQINDNADTLGIGVHSDTICFTNTTDHVGDTTRAASLYVHPDHEFFDDFSYIGPDDPDLPGWWYVRSWDGGPGHDAAAWDPNLVAFVPDPDPQLAGNVLLQMHATTSGTADTCEQSEIGTCQGFFEGTYCARVRFTDDPRNAGERQPSVQAFCTINSLQCTPIYAECDFEYLPSDNWLPYCLVKPALHMLTWDTSCDSSGQRDHDRDCHSLDEWHIYSIQVLDGQVRYYVDYDNEPRATHDGDYYPEAEMAILFQHWFTNGLNDIWPNVAEFVMDVDWVYHGEHVGLTLSEVKKIVDHYRGRGEDRNDTMCEETGSELRQLAKRVLFGGAVKQRVKPEYNSYDDQQFKQLFRDSFKMATLENEHKAAYIWKRNDNQEVWYDWSEADKIVEWCLDNDHPMIVKFHTLVWDNPRYDEDQERCVNDGVPNWLLDGVPDDPNDPYDPNKPYYPNDVRDMLRDYIDAVLKHYCGDARFSDRPDLKIDLYDVVNEWFDVRDDDDCTPPEGRENWWKLHAGEDILEQAFIWAEETASSLNAQGVDFDPVFIYNDFGLIPDPNDPDDPNDPCDTKPELVFCTLDFLKNTQGTPIDAIGFQSHFCDTAITQEFCEQVVGAEFDRYQQAGFQIYVSEFDTRGLDLETQEQYYFNYLIFCLDYGVEAFQMWNFWDGDAWEHPDCPGLRPGLFNDCWCRKPSYYGFYDALDACGGGPGGADEGDQADASGVRPVPPP